MTWRVGRVIERGTDGAGVVRLDAPVEGAEPLPEKGRTVMVDVRLARSPQQHRLYWALLRATVEATGAWATADALHTWVKLRLGLWDPLWVGDRAAVVWHSTDFSAMDQQRFRRFFDDAMAEIALETGIDPETLRKEAERG